MKRYGFRFRTARIQARQRIRSDGAFGPSTAKSRLTRHPASAAISPPHSTTIRAFRSARGTFRSVKMSESFLLPAIPSGFIRSPGRQLLKIKSRVPTAAADRQTSSARRENP